MKSKIFLVAGLLALLLCSCAPTLSTPNQDKSIIQSSGFKQWNVNTPQEKAFFSQFPTSKFITYRKGPQVVHVYKDPPTGAVYWGENLGMSPAAREDAAQQDDPIFWDMWADERGLG